MKINVFAVVLFLVVSFVAIESLQAASAGALDRGFGVGGVSTTPIGNNNYNIPIDFVIDEQNRIITLSRIAENNRPKFLFIRYLPNGEVDTSFGTNGRVVRDPGLVLGGSDRGGAVGDCSAR